MNRYKSFLGSVGLALVVVLVSGVPVGGVTQEASEEEKSAGFTQEDLLKMPSFYYFDYPHQPQPGKRLWLRVDGESWIERYPDGMESRFRMTERTVVDGLQGTVVVKTSGDPAKTGTDNEGGLQAFIPDRESESLDHYYRNLARGDRGWIRLARMKCVH